MNAMRTIRIEKVTLNIGAGKDQSRLGKAVQLLKHITGVDPIKTKTMKRIASWGLRPGLPIGCKITLRKESFKELLPRLFNAKDNILKRSNFDDNGNLSFGIEEYIDIPEVKYDPDIGMMGLQISVTLERPGFRIKKRKINKKKLTKKHTISRDDAISFIKNEYGLKLVEEQQEDE